MINPPTSDSDFLPETTESDTESVVALSSIATEEPSLLDKFTED